MSTVTPPRAMTAVCPDPYVLTASTARAAGGGANATEASEGDDESAVASIGSDANASRGVPNCTFLADRGSGGLGDQLVELVDGHEHRPGLGALGRPHHAPLLEQIHESPGPGEAHPQLALEHGRRPQLAAHHQLPG